MTTSKVSRYQSTQRGWVFLGAIVTLTVLLILGASLIQRSQNALYRTTIDNRSARSFQLAEAGLHHALWSLNQPNGWLTYAGQSNIALAGGTYQVTVSPAPGARGVNTNYLTLLAKGSLQQPNGRSAVSSGIHAIVTKDERYFSYAVFGRQKVTIGNGTVTLKADSYTSTDGSYGGTNVKAHANVGTNSKDLNAVEILPQGEVHGDVIVGAGATTPSACVNNKGTITGAIMAADTPVLLPSITSIPAGAVNLGDVYLDGSTVMTLSAGTYYMTDLDILGSAQIVCNGKVVIYLDQTSDTGSPDVRIGGNGVVNTSAIPSNLVIYCRDDVTNVSFSGASTFYGAIYAPQAAIILNSGAVYGSVIGRTVTMNGATAHVHYDEAIYDPANPHAVIRSWHEL